MTAWEKCARGCGSRARATSRRTPPQALEFRAGLAAGPTALALPPDRPVRLWVLDEMRHGLHGFTRRVRGLPGHRPVVPTQQKYQRGFVHGAVGVGLSRTEFLLTETMDQAHSVEFYRQISRSDPAALHVLIQDGAGFHLPDGDPGLPDNVRVVTLPAYSPEPDPIKDSLCNRASDTLAELEAVLLTELHRFRQDARRVRSPVFDWLLDQTNASSRPVVPIH